VTDNGLIGAVVDGLEVRELVAKGGMGEVYKAFDPQLRRFVALKIVAEVFARQEEFIGRFEREARAASSISHPNVAQIYSFGRWDGRPYYVMEFVEGESLADVLRRRGRISGLRCLDYLQQACDGLKAAHDRGLIHRDIKPGNLMLEPGGRLKIVDFGLARRVGEDSDLTRSGMLLGTPRYMSPEQALASGVDHRSDIYSLGATFYHLFAGEAPFDAETPIALMMRHVHEAPVPLKQRNPRMPTGVCQIVDRMLAKAPAARYQSYDELVADIAAARKGRYDELAPETVVAGPVSGASGAEPSGWQLSPLHIAVGVLAGLLLLLGIGFVQMSHKVDEVLRSGGPEAPVGTTRPGPTRIADADPSAGRPDDGGPGTAPVGYRTGRPATPTPEPAAYRPQPTPGRRLGLFDMAFSAATLSNLKRISTAVEVHKAEFGRLPDDLDSLAEWFDLHPKALLDGWEHKIVFRPTDDWHFRVLSAGPDGAIDTGDDIILEDGYVIQGQPKFPGMG